MRVISRCRSMLRNRDAIMLGCEIVYMSTSAVYIYPPLCSKLVLLPWPLLLIRPPLAVLVRHLTICKFQAADLRLVYPHRSNINRIKLSLIHS